jgi:HSP20 family protein
LSGKKRDVHNLFKEEEMTTQLAAVMQRTNETELVPYNGEEKSSQSAQINNAIARRAFQLFESHGSAPGHDVEDWLQAESELLHQVPLKITESDNKYTVRAEVPGFASEDIEIRVERRSLTISGKREVNEAAENGNIVRSEWCADQIFRTLDLPSDVDSSRVDTTLKDGILIVDLQKI